MTWLPNYLYRIYGLESRGGRRVLVSAVVSRRRAAVELGLLSDALLRRTGRLRSARSSAILLSQLCAGLAVIPVVHVLDLAIACISIALGITLAPNTAYYATTIDVAPRRAGTALGLMNTAFALSGFIPPAVTGYVVSFTGSFGAAFWLLAALAASSVIVVFLFHRPDQEAGLGGGMAVLGPPAQ